MKFFKIKASGDAATIFLYGEISDYNGLASDVVRDLMEAETAYKNIDIRINSMGGDVYAGIAIFNAFTNSKANIRIFVDGIAASMASVIALCGKPVEMSKYARLMLHSVSGGYYGTKEELLGIVKEIETLENTLSAMYSKKTGMTPEEIKEAYFDGKDHWLTADEALSLGFIDGIYDTDPVPGDQTTSEQIYKIFNNRLNKPQTDNNMNLDEIKKRPLFKDCATESDVLNVIAQLEAKASKADSLNSELTAAKANLKKFEDKAKAEDEAAKKKLLDDAETDGRIDAVTRPTYQAFLDKDRENGEAALKALKPKRRVTNDLYLNPTGESPWNKRMREIENKLKH
ncbi:MAG TPA: peptidase [Porphyromonadaceae bacterium]|nr:peptidase [Porphyromonadaceae bacterium]